MSFREEGFMGASGAAIRLTQVDRYRELFEFANECSRLAVVVAALLPDIREKTKLVASIFFMRSLSHFQAAINLAEGGMTIEALVLCRGLVETGFVLCSLAEGAVTPAELVSHDKASRVKQAKAILHGRDAYANILPFENKLNDFVTENIDSDAIDMHTLARKCKALAVYDGLYRHLSHFAAHPSLSAAEPYLVTMPNGQSHAQFRPVLDYTPRAVLSACAGILIGLCACGKSGMLTPETDDTRTRLWNDYMALYARNDPWSDG